MREQILQQALLFDIPGQAVIATDVEGSILSWNGAAETLYGWRAEEVLGRNVLEVTPTDLSRAEATAIMERLRTGATWSGRFLVQRKDGSCFEAHVMDTPVRDDAGELVGVIGISSQVEEPGGESPHPPLA